MCRIGLKRRDGTLLLEIATNLGMWDRTQHVSMNNTTEVLVRLADIFRRDNLIFLDFLRKQDENTIRI